MKITFITPPSTNGVKPAERTAGCTRMVYAMPNIYALTVVALLEQEGHVVNYLDFVLDNKSSADLTEFVKNDDSDCYCFWSVNLSIEADVAALKQIRELRSEVYLFFMGPGPTYYTKQFILDNHCFALRGEPEMTIVELLEVLHSKAELSDVKGISYLNEGKLTHNPSRELIQDINVLPLPNRSFISNYHFINPKLSESSYTTVVTSRNCPFKCIYCVPSSLTFAREIEYKKDHNKKPPITFRSVENVAKEIKLLHKQGYKAIGFMDDNFIVTTKRLREIGAVLKEYNFEWGCQARADAINDEIAQILSETGCKYVDIGVESFNDEILKYIKKGLTSQQIFAAIDSLKKFNVPVKLNILIGTSPIETVATIKQTLRTAKKLNVSQVMFNIVAPFPGTEFYDIAKTNGWIVGGDYVPTDVQRNSIMNYPQLSAKQMERMLFWNNIQFFLRPSFVWRNMRKFRSFGDFYMALRALKIKLFG